MKRETRLLTVRRGAGSTSAGITAGGRFIVSETPQLRKDLRSGSTLRSTVMGLPASGSG